MCRSYLGVSDRKEVSPKKFRPKIVRPKYSNRRISQPDPSIVVFRTDYLRTDFLRTNFLSVRNPKIGLAHEWSRTACVTRSPSPLEYDMSSKEAVGNGGGSRSSRKSRTFMCALSRNTRKSRTFTCAFSRTLYEKVVHCTQKSLRAHTSLTRKSRTFTYALSRLHAQTYLVRTKSPRAHMPYTYAISRLRAQVVLYVRNKSLYAQKSYILCKVAYRAITCTIYLHSRYRRF